jgi:hypothetical protein
VTHIATKNVARRIMLTPTQKTCPRVLPYQQ